ncbi:amidohydrolase [Ohessyouella blattaphilus]|uniref:Amidohydrolase family protein n=1 Tax=Ohessyouella blattaphilus TaxID=2949333 RepID=A0ABT1EKT6_9FIRM|nr:amidohydrolase family protein [Ohessyouella blattaphilus]MCP1110382.1 amidohydrolase family protein [Ohessyouella blattaphilus]MCR8563776.1 amidohydrolase family protein [Ohessyouella blattaphilus]
MFSQFPNYLIKSDNLFTGLESDPMSGVIAITDNIISGIYANEEAAPQGPDTQVINATGKTVAPANTDVHTFFTGYLLTTFGLDLGNQGTKQEVLAALSNYTNQNPDISLIIAQNLDVNLRLSASDLDNICQDRPLVAFHPYNEQCCLNSKAKETYDFDQDNCYSEAMWKLLRNLLAEKELAREAFINYMFMLNQRGVTSVKEMGFDDFYGFTQVLEDLEESNQLTLRVHFMSQPVGAPLNLTYAKSMKDKFHSNFLSFSGFNQMTDGSISQYEGDLKHPYKDQSFTCKKDIDWSALEKDTLLADEAGFRFSLHAQGDNAISKCLSIFAKCQVGDDGKLINRHAITDLEYSDANDFAQMAKLGVVAEVYPQIMSLYTREEKLETIDKMLGADRGKDYWNRRAMADSGVTISCGTDLPLLFPSLQESIYHASYNLFPEGGASFNQANGLSIAEVVKAWTYGGQYNLGRETLLGTLEVGKLADLVIYSDNLFAVSAEQVRSVEVEKTLLDGKIVYEK